MSSYWTRIGCSFHAVALFLVGATTQAQNEIEGVHVETYYVSDANDASDETGGTLVAGSRTYRIYVDLGEGCSLLTMWGDTNHVFSIGSTASIFNNIDRGKPYGHEIQDNRLDENTVALDSWLTLGRASNLRFGVEEADDDDGSIVGGANNDGGSAEIPGGLLVNDEPEAGLPLTVKDGLIPLNGAPAIPDGFFIIGDDPASVFDDQTTGNAFVSDDFTLGCTAPGISGANADNLLLLAQITTAGELSFDLNLLIRRPDGTLAHFVANDSVLVGDEQVDPFLHYPPECGCTNADYLEFDPAAGCDDGSCATLIVFGCLDTTACNYDPGANFNVPQLCCYGPGNCNGLDVSILCPGVGMNEGADIGAVLEVFPNPVRDDLTIRMADNRQGAVRITLHDMFGRIVLIEDRRAVAPDGTIQLDVRDTATGVYLLNIAADDAVYSTRVVIN